MDRYFVTTELITQNARNMKIVFFKPAFLMVKKFFRSRNVVVLNV